MRTLRSVKFAPLPLSIALLSGCGSSEFEDLALLHDAAQSPNAIVAEPDALYLSLGTSVERRNAEGTGVSVLASNEAIGDVPAAGYELTVSNGFLYWLRSTSSSYGVLPAPDLRTEVVRVPKTGGAPEVVARLLNAPTRAFAVSGDRLVTCDVPVPSGQPLLSIVGLADQTRTTRPLGGASAIECNKLFLDADGSAHVSVRTSAIASATWYSVAKDGTVAAEPSPPRRPGIGWRAKSPAPTSAETHELISTSATGAETVLTTGYEVPFVADGSTVYMKSGVGGGNRKTMICDTGSVSIIRGAGVPELLTKGQCEPVAFALTSSRVFWIDDRSLLYMDGRRETALKSLAR